MYKHYNKYVLKFLTFFNHKIFFRYNYNYTHNKYKFDILEIEKTPSAGYSLRSRKSIFVV